MTMVTVFALRKNVAMDIDRIQIHANVNSVKKLHANLDINGHGTIVVVEENIDYEFLISFSFL